MNTRTYDDDSLAQAVAESRSWRGVLRLLGLLGTSAGSARSVRRRADELGLDHAHFTGQRRWSEDDLAAAIATSRTWVQVLDKLGLRGGSSHSAIKGHALRLGLDTSHVGRKAPVVVPQEVVDNRPDLANLARAGSMLAAAWFTMCGHTVTWPLEPCRYDLLVCRDGKILRVQVKTCRSKRASGHWEVSLTTSGHPSGGSHRRTVYGPDEIDCFFVIDGELNCYYIPYAVVGGFTAISLSAYQHFRVATVGGYLT